MVDNHCTMVDYLLSEEEQEAESMKLSRLAPAVAVAALAFAAADISVDWDHKADFSQVKTYSWIGVRAGDSIWQDRISRSVDAALSAKGWQKVESGGDAAVSAFGRTQERDR